MYICFLVIYFYQRIFLLHNLLSQLALEDLDILDLVPHSVSNLYFDSLLQDHKLWNNKTNQSKEGI